MSRIGKKPVQVPAGITATVDGQKVTAKGPKGELFFVANDEIGLKIENNAVVVTPLNDSKDARAKWGMSRTMIENILKGVTASVEGQTVKMKGPKGQLQFLVHDDVVVSFESGATLTAPFSNFTSTSSCTMN